jgi:hypothetical protein
MWLKTSGTFKTSQEAYPMGTVAQSKFETQPQFSSRRISRPGVGAHASTQRAFLASKPERHYRLATDGRKWRLKAKRRRSLALYLVGFPSFYQSLNTIARRLNETAVGNFHWSRRTVCRTLRDLSRLGLVMPSGYMSMRGTRLRVCRPEALRAECGTPAPANVAHKKVVTAQNNNNRQIDSRHAQKTACRPSVSPTPKPPRPEGTEKPEAKPFEQVALEILDYFTHGFGPCQAIDLSADPETASLLFSWLHTRHTKRHYAPPIQYPKAYYIKAAENFFAQYPCAYSILDGCHTIEEMTAGPGGCRITFCAEHQKWQSAKYPCEHCRRKRAA